MGNQDSNFVNTVVDAQKQAVDTMVENTKKFTNGNAIVNETVQKSSEWYKNWLENQKNIFAKATENTTNMGGNMHNNMNQMNEFFQNWYNNQTNWAKQVWEMNVGYFKNAANATTGATNNPMEMWQNMQQNWTNWMSSMNNTNQWMNAMQQFNNLFNMDAYKSTTENWTSIFNQYQDILKTNWTKMQENMQNGTAQDTYKNMMNATESFTKFYEMWAPLWKSIQEKTFNMDLYKQMMNPVAYKDLMDKYLGFMPENSRTYMQQMATMMQDGMKQANNMAAQNYQQMRTMMGNVMPPMNASNMFGNVLSGYNQMYSQMSEAVAPFTRMMTPNQHTKTMMEWQDLANRMAVYNIKNAELQYMMYTQGSKVMDALADNIMNKMKSGEEINSIMALFQEWMNLSDKTFVALFEGDEYSHLMAEVSAMQLKIKKDVEMQLEKFMVGVPVATRSEMDELYKTIYDLKKQVRQMEKMMEMDNEVETVDASEEPKASARRTSTKK
ncbi:MAG: hypothetical protein JST52_04315 [Bacteroidetes bacterium]|nr:hypothetical protein [Bacteroidota bacterium]MBS1741090.1 hypothetical protein [Bacteroidota bacterium]MBS1775414.1 hypothetical protein [Bacteroidota bacterium]